MMTSLLGVSLCRPSGVQDARRQAAQSGQQQCPQAVADADEVFCLSSR